MLDQQKQMQFQNLVTSFTKEELYWANGFLNGFTANSKNENHVEIVSNKPKTITIAYGTETGNSKKLAIDFATKAKQKGILSKVVGLDQYRPTDLQKEEYFLTIISTHGEGEPPEAAKKFYDHIHHNGFTVPKLKYSVLALGDTSYPMFCKTGEDVDLQLQKLGGQRIAPLQKCDVEYEQNATAWVDEVLGKLISAQPSETKAQPAIQPVKSIGKKYYSGEILSKTNLNATGSKLTIFHLELKAEGVEYVAGDSVGIIPENDVKTVDRIIQTSGVDGAKKIVFRNEEDSIQNLLKLKIGIRFLLEKAIKQYAVLVQKELPNKRFDLLELIEKYPLQNPQQYEAFIATLNPIAPRIYNISSSPAAHEGEVHITILQDEFEVDGEKKIGHCSAYFNTKNIGDTVDFFVQTNKRFRLPESNKKVIMIGPGTGVAPFRSFVAERDSLGHSGQNWLFFSNPNFATDFLYQTEWQQWFGTGVINKINVAFANAGVEKITLPEKLLQQASGIWEWIQQGAYIYLCGEKEPLGKEIENTILQLLQTAGNLTEETAKNYVSQLKDEGRYVKDLY